MNKRFVSCLVLLLALLIVLAVSAPGVDANNGIISTFEDNLSSRGGGGGGDTDDGGDPDGVGLEGPGQRMNPSLPLSRQGKSAAAAASGGLTFRMVQLVIVTTSQLIW